jgi:hypothetical protein
VKVCCSFPGCTKATKAKGGRCRAHVASVVSYKPEFCVQGQWYDNAQRFATEAEAKASAHARFMVWTMPSDYRAAESPDPVNYRRVDGRDSSIDDK